MPSDDTPTNPNLMLMPTEEDGAIASGLRKLFGRSYRTTIAGLASVVCGGVVAIGTSAPGIIPPAIVTVCAALAPLIGGAGLMVAKDSRISGLPR